MRTLRSLRWSFLRGGRRRLPFVVLTLEFAAVAVCLGCPFPEVVPMIVLPCLVLVIRPSALSGATLEISAAVGWLLGAAVVFSNPILDVVRSVVFFWSGVGLGVAWLGRAVAAWRRPVFSFRISMVATPIVGLIGLFLIWTDRDFDLRLRWSEPALRASAAAITSGDKFAGPHRIGLFAVRDAKILDGCVLWTTGHDFIDSVGIAYFPSGDSPEVRRRWFRHVRGSWWVFTEKF